MTFETNVSTISTVIIMRNISIKNFPLWSFAGNPHTPSPLLMPQAPTGVISIATGFFCLL